MNAQRHMAGGLVALLLLTGCSGAQSKASQYDLGLYWLKQGKSEPAASARRATARSISVASSRSLPPMTSTAGPWWNGNAR